MTKAGSQYWVENYPVLLQSLAAMTPGMSKEDVAELLDDIDQELVRNVEPGECVDFRDDVPINLYLDNLVQ